MSRFARLKKKWGVAKALSFYLQLKKGKHNLLTAPGLSHPFGMRNNPYDYATFEEVILNSAYQLLKNIAPKFIIDGGGNIGLTACYFASQYPQAKIVTVEPDAGNFLMLQQNTKPYSNIAAEQAGIWSRTTFLKIINSNDGNNAFMVQEVDTPEPTAIKALGIADIMHMHNMPHIDIVKLDIEGAEKEVFEGDCHWLKKTNILIVELHDHIKKGCSKALFEALRSYDFSFSIQGENIVLTNNNPVQ
jgi:FkbM family methyltransferase